MTKTISVPSVGDINGRLPEEAWGVAAGLKQRLNVLNGGDLLVAWAGNELQARTALRDLEQGAARGATTSNDFLEVLKAKPDNEMNGLTLLGTKLARHGAGLNLAQFAYDCPQQTIAGVDCRVAGSGADVFSSLLPQVLTQPAFTGHNMERAWRTALTVSDMLIGIEFETGGHLHQMWGARSKRPSFPTTSKKSPTPFTHFGRWSR